MGSLVQPNNTTGNPHVSIFKIFKSCWTSGADNFGYYGYMFKSVDFEQVNAFDLDIQLLFPMIPTHYFRKVGPLEG